MPSLSATVSTLIRSGLPKRSATSIAAALADGGGGLALSADPPESYIDWMNPGPIVVDQGATLIPDVDTSEGALGGPDLEYPSNPKNIRVKTGGLYLVRLLTMCTFVNELDESVQALGLTGYARVELDLHTAGDYAPQIIWYPQANTLGGVWENISLFLPANSEISVKFANIVENPAGHALTTSLHNLSLSLLRFL